MKFGELTIGDTFSVPHLPDPARSMAGTEFRKVKKTSWYNAVSLRNPDYKMRFDKNEWVEWQSGSRDCIREKKKHQE